MSHVSPAVIAHTATSCGGRPYVMYLPVPCSCRPCCITFPDYFTMFARSFVTHDVYVQNPRSVVVRINFLISFLISNNLSFRFTRGRTGFPGLVPPYLISEKKITKNASGSLLDRRATDEIHSPRRCVFHRCFNGHRYNNGRCRLFKRGANIDFHTTTAHRHRFARKIQRLFTRNCQSAYCLRRVFREFFSK